MDDKQATMAELKTLVGQFVKEREWDQFHNPKNLSMDIACEASELMEKFLWLDNQESIEELNVNRKEIEDELADVLFGVFSFANAAQINLSRALKHKLDEVAKKYPVEKAKGRREKYTKL